MRKLILIALFVFLTTNILQAQAIKDSIPTPSLSLEKIAQANQGESYVTLPVDIGNLEPLLFEANISPNFIVRQRKDSRLMAVLTAQIILRMYDEPSNPIKTPSYLPQMTMYYLTGEKSAVDKLVLFWKLAHHSNGQAGDFYEPNGNINLKSGSFSTNYIEAGFLRSYYNERYSTIVFLKSSLEMHPQSSMIEELYGQYSALRLHNNFLVYKLPFGSNYKNEQTANFSMKVETSWMLDSINDWDLITAKRLNASLIFYYHPKFLEDIGFFVQFYHGTDYYNIYFQHQISSIRFGIMTEVLRF